MSSENCFIKLPLHGRIFSMAGKVFYKRCRDTKGALSIMITDVKLLTAPNAVFEDENLQKYVRINLIDSFARKFFQKNCEVFGPVKLCELLPLN